VQALELQKEAVYGLAELVPEQVAAARVIANPGPPPPPGRQASRSGNQAAVGAVVTDWAAAGAGGRWGHDCARAPSCIFHQ
jgi:hypothetical protein